MSRPRSTETGDPQFPRRTGRAGSDRIRFTVDLARPQHRFLKQFALDADADASAVMRALLWLLQEDEALAKRVVARLREGEQVEPR